MTLSFEFATANRIFFGAGRAGELANHLPRGRKPLLFVRGRSSRAIPLVREILSAQGILFMEYEVHGEPTVEAVREGTKLAAGCDLIIGAGGGSVLDAGKAIAALATNPGDVLDYLEVVGGGQALSNPPLAYIAIPTTAGTGTEVTRNAVIESPAHGVKVSLRSPMMLPRLALVDPELTRDLPPDLTASSGLDDLTQLIDPFVSVKANPITDAFCREGMRLAAASLRRAYRNGVDDEAREGMSLASLFGGLALANAALGVVHGFASPLGGMLHAPHGALCACLLPPAMEANLKALESHHPRHPALYRYKETARLLTGNPAASAQDGVHWVAELVRELGIPPLSFYGMTTAQIPSAVQKTMKASSTKGNPVALTEEELSGILEKALY
jgi:alcohol dehydrogenase class IV